MGVAVIVLVVTNLITVGVVGLMWRLRNHRVDPPDPHLGQLPV